MVVLPVNDPSEKAFRGKRAWISIPSSSTVLGLVVAIALVALVTIISPSTNGHGTNTQNQASSSVKKQKSSSSLLYAAIPMCTPEGVCGESPTHSTPRTIYSSRSEERLHQWWEFHAHLNQSAVDFVAARYGNNKTKKKPAIIFLGDSITEAWLGTSTGTISARAEGVPQVLKESFPLDKYETLILAVSGDQVQHLQWRLEEGGELPEPIRQDLQANFVLLIGTNNLGSGMLPGPTIDGIVQLVQFLLQATKGRVVVLHVLPRGDGVKMMVPLCPPRCSSEGTPRTSFMPEIREVNAGLQQRLVDTTEENSATKRLQLVDCGKEFESEVQGQEVDEGIMPDKLHPNADGHRKLAACIHRYL